MKYTVTVAGKSFEVEIEDLNARPIIARVDGETFEVMPESADGAAGNPSAGEGLKITGAGHSSSTLSPQGNGPASNRLSAPLPGNVTEVFVKAGDRVESGQVILVIEAMKMKNSIRSTRAGQVSAVLVSAGQTVAHKQALVEFDE
ncbi:MAG: biotin/lipoyl-containing protein [Chloroflexota bacterium]